MLGVHRVSTMDVSKLWIHAWYLVRSVGAREAVNSSREQKKKTEIQNSIVLRRTAVTLPLNPFGTSEGKSYQKKIRLKVTAPVTA